ncbi:MAG: hypothetical protein U0903_12875 [Planctomycetales bacterium]
MRGRRLTAVEASVAGLFLAILFALLCPVTHWRENISQSCHLCGNRRIIHQQFRWWQLASENTEFVPNFPIPQEHQHDWWTYSHTFVSWSKNWAQDQGSVYRDGSQSINFR